jgi:hypothetical protein
MNQFLHRNLENRKFASRNVHKRRIRGGKCPVNLQKFQPLVLLQSLLHDVGAVCSLQWLDRENHHGRFIHLQVLRNINAVRQYTVSNPGCSGNYKRFNSLPSLCFALPSLSHLLVFFLHLLNFFFLLLEASSDTKYDSKGHRKTWIENLRPNRVDSSSSAWTRRQRTCAEITLFIFCFFPLRIVFFYLLVLLSEGITVTTRISKFHFHLKYTKLWSIF